MTSALEILPPERLTRGILLIIESTLEGIRGTPLSQVPGPFCLSALFNLISAPLSLSALLDTYATSGYF